jgi:hypothetical protein
MNKHIFKLEGKKMTKIEQEYYMTMLLNSKKNEIFLWNFAKCIPITMDELENDEWLRLLALKTEEREVELIERKYKSKEDMNDSLC